MANERTVLHGIDQSVADYDTLPDRGNIGSKILCEDLLTKHVYDNVDAVWLPLGYIAVRYSVATNGGTVAEHTLAVTIPAGTIIWDGFYQVVDPFTSGGAATIAINAAAAGDILVAEDYATAGTEALHAIVPVGTAATAVRMTAATALSLTIAGAALTSGTLVVFLRCFRGFATEADSSSSVSASSSSWSSVSASSESSSSSASTSSESSESSFL